MITVSVSIFGIRVGTWHINVPVIGSDLPTLNYSWGIGVGSVQLSIAPVGTKAPAHSVEVLPTENPGTMHEPPAPDTALPVPPAPVDGADPDNLPNS